ncbi:hypothetical protein [Streptomyces sp. NPDC059009]|uniref:hypothetical protein n=1 Tax=Streptomyces sp. NPDC059009 TaxID=3346694 RepID=UPI00369A5D7F
MYIKGVSLSALNELTAQVSDDCYGGNVIVARGAHRTGAHAIVARLRVMDSHGLGARTAASGRHGPYACWHAYRDVLARIFFAYPSATVRTCLATYRGIRGFQDHFQATEYHNCGSGQCPRPICELCVMCHVDASSGIADLVSVPRAQDVAARMRAELAEAEDSHPEEEFVGPASLLGAPDLAYSCDR